MVSGSFRKVRHWGFSALLGATVAFGSSVIADSRAVADEPGEIDGLTNRLGASDFRVRVQSALLLGKTADARAIRALTRSLEDDSVAVRAASAAALSTLGDPSALPALERARKDESPAVRRQIESAIAKLEQRAKDAIEERRSARVLVKLASVETSESKGRPEALGTAAQASRRVLGAIPGVALLNPTEDPGTVAARHKRPAFVVHPSIRSLETVSKDGSLVSSARVEFVVQKVPELNITSTLSGDASARGDGAGSAEERSELEASVLGAAIESALRQSGRVLLAAASR